MASENYKGYLGLYKGFVTRSHDDDPLGAGRIQVWIPAYHGGDQWDPAKAANNEYPWAQVSSVNFNNTNAWGQYLSQNGETVRLPNLYPKVGDCVWLSFEMGDVRYPIYMGNLITGDSDVGKDSAYSYYTVQQLARALTYHLQTGGSDPILSKGLGIAESAADASSYDGGSSDFVADTGGVSQGNIVIPSSVKQTGIEADYTNYTYFTLNPRKGWNKDTNQFKVGNLWQSKGQKSNRGIATIDGYYLIAMRPKFGNTGGLVRVNLANGQVIPGLLADEKGSDAGNAWGHPKGGGKISLVEFEAKGTIDSSTSGVKLDLSGWLGQSVVSVDVLGRYPGL